MPVYTVFIPVTIELVVDDPELLDEMAATVLTEPAGEPSDAIYEDVEFDLHQAGKSGWVEEDLFIEETTEANHGKHPEPFRTFRFDAVLSRDYPAATPEEASGLLLADLEPLLADTGLLSGWEVVAGEKPEARIAS